jgi:predicted Zn-dependent peptidase
MVQNNLTKQWNSMEANNAYTTENVTVYRLVSASAAAVIFDLEADRISSLSIDPALLKAKEVLY